MKKNIFVNKKQLKNKKIFLIQSQPNTKYDISLGSITKNVLIGDNNNEIISIDIVSPRLAFGHSTLQSSDSAHHTQKANTGSKKSFIATKSHASQITKNLLQGDQKTAKYPAENKIATILFNPLTMRLKTQVTKKSEQVVHRTTTKGDTLQVKKENKSTKLGKILKQILAKGQTSKIKGHSAISEKNLAQLSIIETNKKFSNHYKGIQIRVSGRLRGAQRARSLLLNHGRISTQSFNSALKFNKKQIPTKWGTWGSSIYLAR